jgi:hypothetical protein
MPLLHGSFCCIRYPTAWDRTRWRRGGSRPRQMLSIGPKLTVRHPALGASATTRCWRSARKTWNHDSCRLGNRSEPGCEPAWLLSCCGSGRGGYPLLTNSLIGRFDASSASGVAGSWRNLPPTQPPPRKNPVAVDRCPLGEEFGQPSLVCLTLIVQVGSFVSRRFSFQSVCQTDRIRMGQNRRSISY